VYGYARYRLCYYVESRSRTIGMGHAANRLVKGATPCFGTHSALVSEKIVEHGLGSYKKSNIGQNPTVLVSASGTEMAFE